MDGDGYKYDFFISYEDGAKEWVDTYLVPLLEREGKRFLRERSFNIGQAWITEVGKAIEHSRNVIVVLTPEYVVSCMGQLVQWMTHTRGAEHRNWPLIPILLRPIDRPLLIRSLKIIDLTEADDIKDALSELLKNIRSDDPHVTNPPPPSPYVGMSPFKTEDAQYFFGRETEIDKYALYLQNNGFLALIGTSGCGKSSLVSAGIIPTLNSNSRYSSGVLTIRKFRPGNRDNQGRSVLQEWLHDAGDPEALGKDVWLNNLLHQNNGADYLLVFIDQFEELFTLQSDKESQKQIGLGDRAQTFLQDLQPLVHAALDPKDNIFVILTVRDEFYPQLAWCKEKLKLNIDAYLHRIPSLGRKGIEDAIRKPARSKGAWLDDVLVERLVSDAGDDPGILPFVQETMRILWERMNSEFCYISRKDYERLGGQGISGLKSAISNKADSAYNTLPSDQHRKIAQRIFIRLIQFGEGKPDTRRQQSISKLQSDRDSLDIFYETLKYLSSESYRLLMLSTIKNEQEAKVDIVHESLIKAWKRLQGWIREQKGNEEKRRIFEGKVKEWQRMGKEFHGLLDIHEIRELDTYQNEEWQLDSLSREFIDKSRYEANPGWTLKGGVWGGAFLLSLITIFLSLYTMALSIGSLLVLVFIFILFLIIAVLFLSVGGRHYKLQKATSYLSGSLRAKSVVVLITVISVSVFLLGGGGERLLDSYSCEKMGISIVSPEIAGDYIVLNSRGVPNNDLDVIKSIFDEYAKYHTKKKGWLYVDDGQKNKSACGKYASKHFDLTESDGIYSLSLRNNHNSDIDNSLVIKGDESLSGCASVMDVGYKFMEYLGWNHAERVYPASCGSVYLYRQCKEDVISKDYPRAITNCERAIKESTLFFNAYITLSYLYEDYSKDYLKAIVLMEEAQKKSTASDHAILAALARAYTYNDQLSLAEEYYLKAISLYKYSLYYNQLSIVYREMGCQGCLLLAKKALKNAHKYNTENEIFYESNKNGVLKNEAIVDILMNNYTESNKKLKSIGKEYAEHFIEEITFYLGMNYLGIKEIDRACETFKKHQYLSEKSSLLFVSDRKKKGKLILLDKCS